MRNRLRFIVKLLNLGEDMQDLIPVLQHRDDSQLREDISKGRGPSKSFRFVLQIDKGLLKTVQI